jgi:hypothetical protein
MAIIYINRKVQSVGVTHTQSLHDLRRVRTQEFAQLLGTGRSSFFAALKAGRIPPPDGRDSRPYWYEKTVSRFLSAPNLGETA